MGSVTQTETPHLSVQCNFDRPPVFRYIILQIDLTKYQQSVGSKYAVNIHHFMIAYLVIKTPPVRG